MNMQLTPVVKNLLIANVVMYVLQLMTGGFVTDYGSLYYIGSDFFMPHQLITYMFLHGSGTHIFYNMLLLFFFGPILERFIGDKKFLLLYMISGLGAGVIQLITSYIFMEPNVTVGASGAVAGVMMAMALLFPNMKVYVYFLFPVKLVYLIGFYVVFELYNGLSMADTGVAHFAHLGGMLFGFIMIKIWKYDRQNFY